MIDWSLLIILLRTRGKTCKQIASAIGVTAPAIAGYCSYGYSPRFDNGVRLLDYASDWLSDEELQRCLQK